MERNKVKFCMRDVVVAVVVVIGIVAVNKGVESVIDSSTLSKQSGTNNNGGLPALNRDLSWERGFIAFVKHDAMR